MQNPLPFLKALQKSAAVGLQGWSLIDSGSHHNHAQFQRPQGACCLLLMEILTSSSKFAVCWDSTGCTLTLVMLMAVLRVCCSCQHPLDGLVICMARRLGSCSFLSHSQGKPFCLSRYQALPGLAGTSGSQMQAATLQSQRTPMASNWAAAPRSTSTSRYVLGVIDSQSSPEWQRLAWSVL